MGDQRKTYSPVQATVPSPEWTYTIQTFANIICFFVDPNVMQARDLNGLSQKLFTAVVGLLVEAWVVTPRESYGNQVMILKGSHVRAEKKSSESSYTDSAGIAMLAVANIHERAPDPAGYVFNSLILDSDVQLQ
jgi:hypothetical protein